MSNHSQPENQHKPYRNTSLIALSRRDDTSHAYSLLPTPSSSETVCTNESSILGSANRALHTSLPFVWHGSTMAGMKEEDEGHPFSIGSVSKCVRKRRIPEVDEERGRKSGEGDVYVCEKYEGEVQDDLFDDGDGKGVEMKRKAGGVADDDDNAGKESPTHPKVNKSKDENEVTQLLRAEEGDVESPDDDDDDDDEDFHSLSHSPASAGSSHTLSAASTRSPSVVSESSHTLSSAAEGSLHTIGRSSPASGTECTLSATSDSSRTVGRVAAMSASRDSSRTLSGDSTGEEDEEESEESGGESENEGDVFAASYREGSKGK